MTEEQERSFVNLPLIIWSGSIEYFCDVCLSTRRFTKGEMSMMLSENYGVAVYRSPMNQAVAAASNLTGLYAHICSVSSLIVGESCNEDFINPSGIHYSLSSVIEVRKY